MKKLVLTAALKSTALAALSIIGFLSPLGHSQARDLALTVPSIPLWTDTGIGLTTGSMVTISASGSWNWGTAASFFGPDGDPNIGYIYAYDQFYSNTWHGALIAYVGADPYQGHYGDGSFFPQTTGYWLIGSSGQFTSPVTGELWLGFNDDAVSQGVSDNAGSVTAQISVVPEPTVSLLVLAGGALCLTPIRKGAKLARLLLFRD